MRQSHVIHPPSNGHNKDHHSNDNDNHQNSNKHQAAAENRQIEKSETVSRATGAAANANAVSKYLIITIIITRHSHMYHSFSKHNTFISQGEGDSGL